jgi:hypothetical protein
MSEELKLAVFREDPICPEPGESAESFIARCEAAEQAELEAYEAKQAAKLGNLFSET